MFTYKIQAVLSSTHSESSHKLDIKDKYSYKQRNLLQFKKLGFQLSNPQNKPRVAVNAAGIID